MSKAGPKPEVRARQETYQQTVPEVVFKVDPPVVNVKPGETFDILLDCESGFQVFVPYPEFFEKLDTEAQRVDPKTIPEKPRYNWWRASMTRHQVENNTDIKEMAYCVYSKDLDNFAVGNSPPKMTLKP